MPTTPSALVLDSATADDDCGASVATLDNDRIVKTGDDAADDKSSDEARILEDVETEAS
jgi:hypothetical protein